MEVVTREAGGGKTGKNALGNKKYQYIVKNV